MTVLIVAAVLLAAITPVLADYFRYGRGALFAPSAFLALYSSLWIVGLDLYLLSTGIGGPDFKGLSQSEAADLFIRANVLIFVYLVCWGLGYRRVLARAAESNYLVVRPVGAGLSPGVVGLVALGLACAVFMLAIQLRPEEGSRSGYTQGASGKLLFVVVSLLIAATAVFFAKITSVRLRWWRIVLLVVVALGTFVALGALGGRTRALTTFLFLLVIFHYNYRPVPVRFIVVAFLAMITAAMSYSIYEKGGLKQQASSFLEVVPYVMYDKSFGRNFDAVENLCVLLRTFDEERIEFTGGVTSVADVLKDLSLDIGIQDTRTMFLEKGFGKFNVDYGVPITKVGEGFLAAGYAGVVFYGLLLGALSGCVFRYLVMQRTLGPLSPAAYIVVLINFGLADANGYVWSPVVLATVASICVLILGYLFLGMNRVAVLTTSRATGS